MNFLHLIIYFIDINNIKINTSIITELVINYTFTLINLFNLDKKVIIPYVIICIKYCMQEIKNIPENPFKSNFEILVYIINQVF